ncbi:Sec62/63 complex, subunit Sec66 [Annulohypoxylon maeteangense]|uniref:Sec62/63 complex, subunit Sec66 n=1 Tax=Annulohypoxylon maeteangense TaxID=1927788 RepID=UPI0020074EBA|nr:Sec62/63 complex, subunit Sec66 [Annulohypoxylon maeteangense]KAI0889993.1 Sec62/63 complex, subunit Sec66 [Annulohypoxylon maeteangense]
MFDIDWLSLALPFAYITVLGGSLYTFSTIYRKRKASQSANLEPWFPSHLQRNIYLTLLHMEPEPGQEKAPKVPDSVIRAALLRRAVEDIRRIIQIRTSKQALNTLLQRGSVGEDLNQRFTRAEKEIEEELRDVVTEANALAPGWGQTIFQSANEIAANTMLRTKLDEIESRAETDKEWWEKRREAIKKDFMRELDEESSTKGSVKGSDDDAVLVDSGTPASTPGGSRKKKGGKK